MPRTLILLLSFSLLLSPLTFARTRSVDVPPLLGDVTLSREIAVSDIAYGPGLAYNDGNPRIAVGPAQELVVWKGKAVRLDADGNAIDALPITLPIEATAVAWNGQRYVAFGHEFDRIDSVEITTDGVIGPVNRGIAHAGEINVYGLDATITAHDTLLAWTEMDRDGVRSVRILSLANGLLWSAHGYDVRLIHGDGDLVLAASTSGCVLFDGARLIPLGVSATNAAWTGHDFFAVAAAQNTITGFHVSRDAVVGPPIAIHTSTDGSASPAVDCSGDTCRVFWKEKRIISQFFYLVDAAYDLQSALVVNDVAGNAVTLDTNNDHPTRYAGIIDTPAAANGILVWSRALVTGTFELRDFFASRVEPALAPRDISQRARGQSALFLTPAPSGVRVWWEESLFPSYDRRSALIDVDGRRTNDASGITTTPIAATANEVLALRLDHSIDVLDATTGALLRNFTLPLPIGTASCSSSDCVGISGSTLLRFNTSGAVIGEPLTLAGFNILGVAARGNDYLVAVYDGASGFRVGRFFSGNRISDLTSIPSGGMMTALLANEDAWLATMQDGALTKTFLIDDSGLHAGVQFNATATRFAWDGSNWIAVWNENHDIYARRLSRDAATAGAPFAVAATPYDETLGAIKSIGNGRTAVMYLRTATEQRYGGAQRVFIRWIENR